jgi:Asp-tRNA(Asn)/Glu-tRNA(Gln) amidotransferase A subunit family amidase
VPVAVKELEPVAGWPHSEGSLVFGDRVAHRTSRHVERLLGRGGAVAVGQTTSSEFGGLNVGVSRLHGVTRNPWDLTRSPGGSSAGSAAAVAGGLVPLATGGDGGGSIRIPAGYTGLLGMKGTFGRITRAPRAYTRPDTIVLGCLARSVRDVARYFDVCAGLDPYDPSTLPSPGGWERALGTSDLRGLRVGVVPDLGGAVLAPGMEGHVRRTAEWLASEAGARLVDLRLPLPNLAAHWAMGNLVTLRCDLGDRWPRCAGELTDEVAFGMRLAESLYNTHTAAALEEHQLAANEAMARAFESVDLIVAATNPGPPFPAEWATSTDEANPVGWAAGGPVSRTAVRGTLLATRIASALSPRLPDALLEWATGRFPSMVGMGAATMVSNLYGNPAVSVPAGEVDGLPAGVQVLAAHHRDGLLLDVALLFERERPWPLPAPAP